MIVSILYRLMLNTHSCYILEIERSRILLQNFVMCFNNGSLACLVRLKKSEVPHVVKTTHISGIVLRIKAKLDQLMLGLNEAGSLDVLRKYSAPYLYMLRSY